MFKRKKRLPWFHRKKELLKLQVFDHIYDIYGNEINTIDPKITNLPSSASSSYSPNSDIYPKLQNVKENQVINVKKSKKYTLAGLITSEEV